jgi:hypothetical protein
MGSGLISSRLLVRFSATKHPSDRRSGGRSDFAEDMEKAPIDQSDHAVRFVGPDHSKTPNTGPDRTTPHTRGMGWSGRPVGLGSIHASA